MKIIKKIDYTLSGISRRVLRLQEYVDAIMEVYDRDERRFEAQQTQIVIHHKEMDPKEIEDALKKHQQTVQYAEPQLLQQLVFDAMKRLGGKATTPEVVEETGLKPSQVNTAFTNLRNKKLIDRLPRGREKLITYLVLEKPHTNLESKEVQENILLLLKQNKGKMMLGDISTFFGKEFSKAVVEANCLALVGQKKLKPAVNQLYQLA